MIRFSLQLCLLQIAHWRRPVRSCGVRACLDLLRISSIALIVLAKPLSAATENRVALVIGNSQYSVAPLRNPTNDATDVAQLLSETLGFKTSLLIDADQAEMRNAIREFSQSVETADVRLFYYAGHGISVNGSNYMVPIGANISDEADVPWEAIDTSLVLDTLERHDTGANLVILDACRDNPLPASSRSSSRGLARLDSPVGSLILYATAPGQVAYDGTGRNGTFTKHLLRSLAAPDVHMGDLALDVRVAVMRETNNQQVPWSESSLTRRIYLAGQTGESLMPSAVASGLTTESSQKEEGSLTSSDEDTMNYESSIVSAYLSAAEAGDAMAQASLGYIYETGRSVADNKVEAYRWYRRAANQNQADAMVNLAGLHLRGEGVEKDAVRAFSLLSEAADAGHPTAQRNLGALFQFGDGIEQDYRAARHWFEKAAEQGHVQAFVDLGDLYSRGLGVVTNEEIAFAWYLKAAQNGLADAQVEVGYYYDQGLGIDQDYHQARNWFEKAATQGHPTGLFNLAEAFELGKGVAVDKAEARALYKRAENAGASLATEALRRLGAQ